MDVFEKLHFVQNLRQELKAIKDKIWTADYEMHSTEQIEYVQSNKKLEEYWTALFSNIPPIDSYLLNKINLNEKVPLNLWIPKLASFSRGMLLGQSHDFFSLPKQIEDAMIWGKFEKWWLDDEATVTQGDTYWLSFFKNLESWRFIVGATLEQTEWNVHKNQVNLKCAWTGSFEKVKELDLMGQYKKLWGVSFQDNDISNSDISKASSFLINAQLIAQRGKSDFFSVKLDSNQLVTTITIPRADISGTQQITTTLSKKSEEDYVDYLIDLAKPHYLEASLQLEKELKLEFDDWRTRKHKKGNIDLDKIQEELIGQLILTRQKYFSDESN